MKYERIKDLDKKDKLRFIAVLILLIISVCLVITIDTKGEIADKLNKCMETYSYDYCNAVIK